MDQLQKRLIEFTKMHDDFIVSWNEAMKTGDTSGLDRMADDYYVAFFQPGTSQPMIFSKQQSIDGMKQSVSHFIGATKKFENRVIRLRDAEQAVVFYELLLVKDEEVTARLFTIENWELINERWMITRETEEPIH